MIIRRVRNQKGVSLVEVIASAGVMAVMFYSLSSLVAYLANQQRVTSIKATVISLRQNFTGLISNQDAWTRTLDVNINGRGALPNDPAIPIHANAANLRCMLDTLGKPPCYDSVEVPAFGATDIYIVNPTPAGETAFSGNPLDGFDHRGRRCNTFNLGAGDDTCPMRVKVDWTVRCPTGGYQNEGEPGPPYPCLVPQSVLTATFFYNPRDPLLKNIIPTDAARAAPAFAIAMSRIDIEKSDPADPTLTPEQICALNVPAKRYLPILPPGIDPDSTVVDSNGCVPLYIWY